MTENIDTQKKDIETALFNAFVAGRQDLLDPYYDLHSVSGEPYYFKWAESDEGAVVFFKPRLISFRVLTSWLNNPGVIDIQIHRQSSVATTIMGRNEGIQEIAVLLSREE